MYTSLFYKEVSNFIFKLNLTTGWETSAGSNQLLHLYVQLFLNLLLANRLHHIVCNLTTAVNKRQDYRTKCTKKNLNGIWLTDFLKSLFIPMRYKTNTALFSIWISLKITQSKSVKRFFKFTFTSPLQLRNRSKYTFRLQISNKIF